MSVPSVLSHPVIRLVAKALLAVAVLAYIVYMIEPSEIWQALQEARWSWVGMAALLLPVNLFLEGQVWRKMLLPVARDQETSAIYQALLCGFSLGVFTPARVGEFAGRAFYLTHSDRWETSVTVLMQRLLDMAVTVTLGTFVLGLILAQTNWLEAAAWWAFFAVSAVVALGLLGMLLLPSHALALLTKLVTSASVVDRLRLLERVSPGYMAGALGLAGLRYAVYITQFAFLTWAFTDAALLPLYGVLMLVYLAKFLAPSITLMDLGLREGFAVFFFGAVGLSQVAAFNASMFVFLLNVALPALMGLPFVLRMQLQASTSQSASSSESTPAEA